MYGSPRAGLARRLVAIGTGALVGIAAAGVSVGLGPLAPAHAAVQATFYVSPTGNDSNPGTAAAPFRTITRSYATAPDSTTSSPSTTRSWAAATAIHAIT